MKRGGLATSHIYNLEYKLCCPRHGDESKLWSEYLDPVDSLSDETPPHLAQRSSIGGSAMTGADGSVWYQYATLAMSSVSG